MVNHKVSWEIKKTKQKNIHFNILEKHSHEILAVNEGRCVKPTQSYCLISLQQVENSEQF